MGTFIFDPDEEIETRFDGMDIELPKPGGSPYPIRDFINGMFRLFTIFMLVIGVIFLIVGFLTGAF